MNPALGTAREGSLPAVVIHQVKEAELDEMWSFVGGKKHPRWLWGALDHQTGRILNQPYMKSDFTPQHEKREGAA